jgi:hypothetical protein
MSVPKEALYRFPWSKTDNPGAWVEVTDECDLDCPGCYRHRLEGHRPLDELKRDILALRKALNCERIAIAGGEPLLYPQIVEVVDFIARQGMKPMILTNGERLTPELLSELKKAGLKLFYFHVDSGQQRPGWEGKTEAEMNGLRQKFADLLWEAGGLQCGYNITVFPSTLSSIPDILSWARANIHKVQHVSLISFRSILLQDGWTYEVNGCPIDTTRFHCATANPDDLDVSVEKMAEVVGEAFPDIRPCAFLNGTTSPRTYKFLIYLVLGTKKRIYGCLGPKTAELVQVFYHFAKGHYLSFQDKAMPGKKVFLLGLVDREARKSWSRFRRSLFREPRGAFEKIYVQCINLQQPNETLNGKTNLCDGCLNMMFYHGQLIHSCQLDEYRLFGGPIQPGRPNKKDESRPQEGL